MFLRVDRGDIVPVCNPGKAVLRVEHLPRAQQGKQFLRIVNLSLDWSSFVSVLMLCIPERGKKYRYLLSITYLIKMKADFSIKLCNSWFLEFSQDIKGMKHYQKDILLQKNTNQC